MIDDQSQEFLKDLAYDLRKREWDRIGQDFEVILDDCPENTNAKAGGQFFCSGYNSRLNYTVDKNISACLGISNFRDDSCMKKIHGDVQRRTECWPKDWLPEDLSYLRVIGVNYDTNLSMWTPSCPIEGIK